MQKKGSLIFLLLFLTVLAAVPIVQLVGECIQGERVQAFDLFEDTFRTPVKRGKALEEQYEKIKKSIGILNEKLRLNEPGADYYDFAQDIHIGAKALQRKIAEVNRYVTRENSPQLYAADSLVTASKALLDNIDDETGQIRKLLEHITSCIDECVVYLPSKGPFTAAENVFTAFFSETFFNNHYLRAYEKELEDRSVFVLSIRPIVQMIRYWLLGDVGVKAIAGKNGWLYYRPGVEYLYRPSIFDPRSKSVDYNDKALTDDPVGTILDFRDQLAERNVELMVVIVPGKGSIYPDMLSGKMPAGKEKRTHTGVFIEQLRGNGITTVDLFSPFLAERAHDTLCGDSLYLARDTHWRPRALQLTARTVAEEVKKYSWYREPHQQVSYGMDTVEVERTGDVGVMTNLPNVRIRRMSAAFPTEMTKCFPILHNYLNDSGAVVREVPYKDDLHKSRILILGDSFSRIYQTDAPRNAGWIAHLAYELSEPLSSLVSDGGASTLVREKLARNTGLLKRKKLVIWEFVERDIRFGAFGWKKVSLP